jgi:F-type H+-transporting ATPase subunit epsilon
MSKLTVEMVTANGTVLSTEADFVLAPGIDGELGVMPNHIPLLTPLRTGQVMVRNGGDEEHLFVSGGFLEVTPSKVVVLADAAERGDDIDTSRADAARKAAEKALASNATDADAAAALERAVFRLKVADLRRRPRSHSSRPNQN